MYPYPHPVSEATWWTLVIHLLFLIVGTVPAFLLLKRSRKRASSSQLWLLTLAFVALTAIVLAWSVNAEKHERPFLLGYLFYFSVMIIASFAAVAARVKRQLGRTPVSAILLALLGLLFLIGLFLPSVPSAREAARRMSCSQNLKQLSLSLLNYGGQHGSMPSPIGRTDSGQLISWRVEILPFCEFSSIYDEYDPRHAFDEEPNRTLQYRPKAPYLFTCPSDYREGNTGTGSALVYSSYSIPVGTGAVSEAISQPLEKFMTTQGSKLLILEACGADITWSEPREVELSVDSLGVNLPGNKRGQSRAILSSRHADGANSVRVDGSVLFVSDQIDPVVLRQLCERHSP